MRRYPTAVVLTTEKDAQRLVSLKGMPPELKARLFYLPIVSEIIPRDRFGTIHRGGASRTRAQTVERTIIIR